MKIKETTQKLHVCATVEEARQHQVFTVDRN